MDGGISEVYLAYAAMAASAAGAGVSAYSSAQSGRARAAAANYQAQVALNNQKIAAQYAQTAVDRGNRLEESKRQATAQQEGAVRAAAGASGVEVNSGSPLRLQEDTAKTGELDAQTIRSNAAYEAYGYRVKGLDYGAQAQLDEMASADAARSGVLGAWSSILGGASSVSDQWLGFKLKAGNSKKSPLGGGYYGGGSAGDPGGNWDSPG